MEKSEKLQRNPMSLKKHIKNEIARIRLFIGHANFKKMIIKQFNWIKTQQCEIPDCNNRAMGGGGTKEDGTMRLVCHQED